MTLQEKKRLRAAFFARIGPNAAAFRGLLEHASELCFYMKDRAGRIMALNRRNCEVCNIRSEWDAIGLTSRDLFPPTLADDYMALDREVLATGRPVLQRVTAHPADYSNRLMISDVHPLRDRRGRIVGTARTYRLTGRDSSEARNDDALRAVADEIDRRYAESLPLDALARRAGMSKSTFKRTFTRLFEVSPGQYLLRVRLNAARRLLETTDKLISDIALECGFYDQSHFSRLFQRARGLTPGAYRRTHARRREKKEARLARSARSVRGSRQATGQSPPGQAGRSEAAR